MSFNLVTWTLVLAFAGIPHGWAQEVHQGIWSRSTWWCASRVSSAFDERKCSLEIGFNSRGECTWAELTYWWTSSTGILEHLSCVSEEDGVFKIYRETQPSSLVYEGRLKEQTTNLWGRPVLIIETPQGDLQTFKKGMP